MSGITEEDFARKRKSSDAGLNADADHALTERTQGLVTKDQYNKMRSEVESGVIAQPEEKEEKVKKKKKKKTNTSNLSFGDDVEEMEDVSPRVKKKNPNVNTAFLAKKEWLTKDTKAALAAEEKEKIEAMNTLRKEMEERELTVQYDMTLRPLGDQGKLNTYNTGGGEEMVVEDKPPRYFRNQKVTCKYGITVETFLEKAADTLKKGTKAAASSNLLLVCGDFICPEHQTFFELEQSCKYDDGDSIFRFQSEGEGKEAPPLHVMERSWYEMSRFHYPQSGWSVYDRSKSYKNPAKNKLFKAVGSQDEITQWNKSQGVEEGFIYKDSAHRSNWQK